MTSKPIRRAKKRAPFTYVAAGIESVVESRGKLSVYITLLRSDGQPGCCVVDVRGPLTRRRAGSAPKIASTITAGYDWLTQGFVSKTQLAAVRSLVEKHALAAYHYYLWLSTDSLSLERALARREVAQP